MSALLGPSGQTLSSTTADAAPQPGGGEVKQTTTQTFAQDVIEPSRDRVVLVDFWAPWCGPCTQLAPILEKAVRAFQGAVSLVKMDIDQYPEIAGQLGIRSIPAVIAFRNGQPLDGFMGVQTADQIRAFLERIAGPATDGIAETLEEADLKRGTGDYEEAMALYGAVLQSDPDNAAAYAGLGMVSLDVGNIDQAKEVLAQTPPHLTSQPPLVALDAAIRLAEQAASVRGAHAELQAKVDADPDDHQARYDLALALAGSGDREAAVDALMHILRRDREWNDGAARQELIHFFEAWGPKDPATQKGRRQMASVLFA